MTFTTCDLCDANEDKLADGTLQALSPDFRQFGGWNPLAPRH